jgi:hypothetical protein
MAIMLEATSWLDKLRSEDTPLPAGAIGWHYKSGRLAGFAYGGRFYRTDGTTTQIGAGPEEFHRWYMPTGSREAWLAACKLLTDRKRPELDILIAAAFAAPLTVFAGTLYGPVLTVWGQPGTSKSTAQQVAAAVWGHPRQTRESLTTTARSIIGRLGRIRNLAGYWDDIQDGPHMRILYDTLFLSAEGTEGSRLNKNSSYQERRTWQTVLVACANTSFVEYLTRKPRPSAAALRRVFEFEYNKRDDEPGIINALAASRAFAALEHNYGAVGAQYAALIACEHETVSALVANTIDRFAAAVGGRGDEVFWIGLCGVLIAGAMLAGKLGAELDVMRMEKFLAQAFLDNRKIRTEKGPEAGSYDYTERAIMGFINHWFGSGNVLVTDALFRNKWGHLRTIIHPSAGHPVHIQIARNVRTIVLSKRVLRKWLKENGIPSLRLIHGLKKWFKASERRLVLGGGTEHAQPRWQEGCIVIPVNSAHNPLYDFLTRNKAGSPRPAGPTAGEKRYRPRS